MTKIVGLTDSRFTATSAQQLASLVETVADPHRLRILALLSAGEMTIRDITARLPIAQPTVTHHVLKLQAAGLVTKRRAGVFMVCTLVPGVLASVSDALHPDGAR